MMLLYLALVSVSKSVFLLNFSSGSLCSHLQTGKGKTELRYSDFPACISIPVRCVNSLPLSLFSRTGLGLEIRLTEQPQISHGCPPEAAMKLFRGSPFSCRLLLILFLIMAVPIKSLLPEPGIDQSNPGAQYPSREFCNSQPCVCHLHSAHSARHCLVQYVQVRSAAHPAGCVLHTWWRCERHQLCL